MSWHQLSRFLPIVAMCASAIAFAACGLVLMQSVGGNQIHASQGLTIAFVVFVVALFVVVCTEVRRMGHRFDRPEHQMRIALQRIRAGDVGFRVSLRRGEPLAGMARECNELLEWLNMNPPVGMRTGGDIVDVCGEDEDHA